MDARQPHPVGDCSLAARQGIGSEGEPIVITLGESGAGNANCWALCETGVESVDTGEGCTELDANAIASVAQTSGGVYEIVLDRPISGGYWTQITYLGDDSSVWYASLPADVGADRTSTAGDIGVLVDCVNLGGCSPYRCDIDRSGGACAAPDIGTEIDLLNGAGKFRSWLLASIPAYHPTCGGESLLAGGPQPQDDSEQLAAYFVAYLASADPDGEQETTEFETIADLLTGWVVQHFDAAQQAALVDALTDPEQSFASQAGENKAAAVAETLGA